MVCYEKTLELKHLYQLWALSLLHGSGMDHTTFKCAFLKVINLREILTNVLRILIYELFLETFYEKMIKQLIFLTDFYIFHENCVKNFLT